MAMSGVVEEHVHYVRTFTRAEYDRGPTSQSLLVLAKKDKTAKSGESGRVLIKGGAEGLPSCGSSQVGSPNALDVESSVLATFVFLTLESAKLGVVEDVVVGGGGMSASKVDLPPAFVRLISK